MAKTKEETAKKYPGLEVTAHGHMIVRENGQAREKHFEETFFVPKVSKLSIIQHWIKRYLIRPRLASKNEAFIRERKVSIKGLPKEVEDTGFSKIEAKDIYDMNGEEIRQFILFKDLPESLMADVFVDSDVVERVKAYLEKPEAEKKKESEPVNTVGGKAVNEKWEDLED